MFLSALALSWAALLAVPPLAEARVVERLSVSSAGTQCNDSSFQPSISADGRFVAFSSWASNLVPGDTNGRRDYFLLGGGHLPP